MFVLGVDPGLSRCGYAIVEPGARGGGRAVCIGVIRTATTDPTPVRLAEIQREFRGLLREYHPAVVSVERIFFQNNVRTAVSVAQAIGVICAESISHGADVVEYSPNQVKSAVAGDGRADKTAMTHMVQTLLGLSTPPKPADAADAAALALCHLAHDPSGFVKNRHSAQKDAAQKDAAQKDAAQKHVAQKAVI